jgi:hypothetical protein
LFRRGLFEPGRLRPNHDDVLLALMRTRVRQTLIPTSRIYHFPSRVRPRRASSEAANTCRRCAPNTLYLTGGFPLWCNDCGQPINRLTGIHYKNLSVGAFESHGNPNAACGRLSVVQNGLPAKRRLGITAATAQQGTPPGASCPDGRPLPVSTGTS